MKRLFFCVCIIIILSACGVRQQSETAAIEYSTQTPVIHTVEVTRLSTVIVRHQVTSPPRIVEKIEYRVVTAIYSGPTLTPTIAPTKTPINKTPKTHGYYLVPNEISPGTWKSDGSSDSCYWVITTATGDIISNHFGMAGGSMYIPVNAYEVRLEPECGRWTFVK